MPPVKEDDMSQREALPPSSVSESSTKKFDNGAEVKKSPTRSQDARLKKSANTTLSESKKKFMKIYLCAILVTTIFMKDNSMVDTIYHLQSQPRG